MSPTPPPFINETNFPAAKFSNLSVLLNLILPNLFIGAGIIFFMMLVLAGFRFMNSDGKPENLNKIKSMIYYSIIGMTIVLGAYMLVSLIGKIFNVAVPF